MSRNSQVIFQTTIDLQVILKALIYLAAYYTNTAIDSANTVLLDARQAMLLLEMVLTEASLDRIEQQKLLAVELAYVDLELFIERLQIALDVINSQDVAECL